MAVEWSKCFLGLGIIGLLCLPNSVSAAEVSIQSDTLVRGFQRDTATDEDVLVLPVYEYLQVDVGSAENSNMSFHLYGWGRMDSTDSELYSKATAGELLYGYLEYAGSEANFRAKLGRQHVFTGMANEAFDGVRLSSDLGSYFSGTIYGGQQVALRAVDGSSGDNIVGGRLANSLIGLYDLGLSYKKIRNNSINAEETAGLDLAAYLPGGVNLYGVSTYNLETEDWGEHSYELRFSIGTVEMRPYIQKFQYIDYFGTGANSAGPFWLLAGVDDGFTVGGADLTMPLDSLVLVGKLKQYSYDELDGNSSYFGGQATWSGENMCQIGGEIGIMTSDVANNEYNMIRIFTYWDQLPASLPLGFMSGDIIYVNYDEAIYDVDSSLFASLGAGKKYKDDALEVKVSVDYSSDPYFDKDVKGMLTASYRFGLSQ